MMFSRKADPFTPSKDLTPNMNSIKKGPSVFMKPNLPTKKKFQMAAPDAAEVEKFDKLTIQKIKADEANRDISNSALKKKIDDKVVAPRAFVDKTKTALAYHKVNPRPPSEALNRNIKAADSDGYSDENYDEGDGFEKEEADDDLKLENIRRALAKENLKA